ncbi:MAG: hypothetical protein AAFU71_08545, partial [Cyanobacteria bacterium J06632_22]
ADERVFSRLKTAGYIPVHIRWMTLQRVNLLAMTPSGWPSTLPLVSKARRFGARLGSTSLCLIAVATKVPSPQRPFLGGRGGYILPYLKNFIPDTPKRNCPVVNWSNSS